MEALIPEISRLLVDSLSPDKALVSAAEDGLGRLAGIPYFPLALLSVARGGESQALRIAAATYLKNFLRCHKEGSPISPELHNEFRNQLAGASLQVEPAVLKVLVEALRVVVINDFVKGNSWPELVPEFKSVIQGSSLIGESGHFKWNTINALTVLQAIVRPFQYFLNPKISKEPTPPQLELIAEEILVPLRATFHYFVDKVLSIQDRIQVEFEQVLLIICKCINFTVRSYMPSALGPVLPFFCEDFFRILDSLNLDGASDKDGFSLRLKTAKRILIVFHSLVTRHRKHVDKLMPSIINCAFKISKQSTNMSNLDFLSERVISLAFDVISHVLETGPGWRYVSPHFSSLLDFAILPALAMNQKDILEWEEDADEYIRKNLPSDLGEISGWAEDLFTARKSAINLLGVIAMSKGPRIVSSSSKRKKGDKYEGKLQSSVGEALVIPYLSKFPMPSVGGIKPSKIMNDYYGVLMAYGGLQDFLRERSPEYTTTLIQNRVFPLYSLCPCPPYLIATANWVLGELASCLPQAVSADVYSSLMKAFTMPDIGDVNYFPVHASAAGAIAELFENDYGPPDWLPLLQVLVERMACGSENESSLLFELLGTVIEFGQEKVAAHIPLIVSRVADAILKHLPPIPEPWPQVVEHGFAALAVMAQTWEDSVPDEVNQCQSTEWQSGTAAIASVFSSLLQQAWTMPIVSAEGAVSSVLPPPSCIDDSSALLGTIMRFITSMDEVNELKIMELLAVWTSLIADWHSWEEMEDLSIFKCILEAVHLHQRCGRINILMKRMPSEKSFPSSPPSIIEGISAFVSEAITAYPSATWRAFSCAHILLHVPRFSFQMEGIKQWMALAFTQAAISRFREICNKPVGLWKPLLLVISSCYVSYPVIIEQVLEKNVDQGFTIWAHGLVQISSSSFEPPLSSESEIKLAVIALAKVVERLMEAPVDLSINVLRNCFVSLMEACVRLKKVQDEDKDGVEDVDDASLGEEIDDDEAEDSDDDNEREETEEEFLDRYAKAAEELENEMVEEGDVEDGELELELGDLDGVDIQKMVVSLIERYSQVLMQGQPLPSSLIQGILEAFPEHGSFFCSS